MHRLTVDRGSRATVVIAEGELDAFVAPDLSATFSSVADNDRLVADLTSVSFMDSTALGLLVRVVREADGRGAEIRVVLPQSTARRIFEITTLDRVLPVAPSRAQALAELDGEA
ncbi:MAG: STAS domain-containing protein [Gaiellaceae bacterium]